MSQMHTKLAATLPKGWKLQPLAQVAQVIDCKHRTPVYTDQGYPVVRPRDVRETGICLEQCLRTSHEEYKDLTEKRQPQPGDIVYSRNATFGVASLVDTQASFAIGQDVCLIVPENVDSRYLYRLLNAPLVKQQLGLVISGSTFKRINLSEIRKLQILLPPLEEQRRIAAILDKADAVRRKRQSAIALTEELLRSAFLEMFDTSVAKSWEMATVEQLLASKTGAIRTGPFGSQLLHSEFISQGIAVLGIDNVVQNQFRWVQLRFISEKKYEQLKRYTVSPGDVLISIMGTCGRCAIVPDDCPKAINTKHLCCITLNRNKCYPEFLQSYFLIHPKASNYLKKNAKGAIMEGLNMSIIKDLPVPLVPIKLQKQYVNLQRQILSSKVSAIESRDEADNLFNSLLQRAFQGEL